MLPPWWSWVLLTIVLRPGPGPRKPRGDGNTNASPAGPSWHCHCQGRIRDDTDRSRPTGVLSVLDESKNTPVASSLLKRFTQPGVEIHTIRFHNKDNIKYTILNRLWNEYTIDYEIRNNNRIYITINKITGNRTQDKTHTVLAWGDTLMADAVHVRHWWQTNHTVMMGISRPAWKLRIGIEQ